MNINDWIMNIYKNILNIYDWVMKILIINDLKCLSDVLRRAVLYGAGIVDVESDHRRSGPGDAQWSDARTVDIPDRVARTTGRIFNDPSSQTFDYRHAVRDIESLSTAATASVGLVLSVLSDVRYEDLLRVQTMLGEFLRGFCI